MSFIPVLQYIGGAAVLGFIGWVLDGILEDFIAIGIHETGDAWNILMYLWTAVFIIYMVFGGWWMVRKYNELEYRDSGGLM